MKQTKILWLKDSLRWITMPLHAVLYLIYVLARPVSRFLFGKNHPLSAPYHLVHSIKPRSPKQRRDTLPGDAGNPAKVPVERHHIDLSLISPNALKVVQTLQAKGYYAFIVGGAVRDLLLGMKPKDFDIATNATPAQVQVLFRRALLIGRRFQIVHVQFGQEIIEVSTFRTSLQASAQDAPAAPSTERKAPLFSKYLPSSGPSRRARRGFRVEPSTHLVNADGLIVRDNVWGSQHEDVARRDFTVNAMYYDPKTQTIVDYYNGIADVDNRVLRMIGDPATRYREDPMRMLRAIRFAAKLGFEMAPETSAPIRELAEHIRSVPAARLFDEVLKLLLCGHALNCLQRLRAEGLHHGILPLLDEVLEAPQDARFFTLALSRTDTRIHSGKSISPSFLFAALLWHEVRSRWEKTRQQGHNAIPALNIAINDTLSIQTEQLALRKRYIGDMRIIWDMQPRLEKRGRSATRLLEHPRFRAAYDFLLLRCEAGELNEELGQWWTAFIQTPPEERAEFLEQASRPKTAQTTKSDDIESTVKKPRRRRTKKTVDAASEESVNSVIEN